MPASKLVGAVNVVVVESRGAAIRAPKKKSAPGRRRNAPGHGVAGSAYCAEVRRVKLSAAS